MKCVIIMDGSLPKGLAANTAAALGLSIGNHVSGLIGPDMMDLSGEIHKGITAIPIPILDAERPLIRQVYQQSRKYADVVALGFDTVAQGCNSYTEYMALVSESTVGEMDFIGICLYGPRKKISSLCGQMKLLR